MRDADANGIENMNHTSRLRHDAFTTNIAASTDAVERLNKKKTPLGFHNSKLFLSILSVASECCSSSKKNRSVPLSTWLHIIYVSDSFCHKLCKQIFLRKSCETTRYVRKK